MILSRHEQGLCAVGAHIIQSACEPFRGRTFAVPAENVAIRDDAATCMEPTGAETLRHSLVSADCENDGGNLRI